jgi:hypothetical protein
MFRNLTYYYQNLEIHIKFFIKDVENIFYKKMINSIIFKLVSRTEEISKI